MTLGLSTIGITQGLPAIEPPTLLDLCCGAGGAAMGYHHAGFRVIGIDSEWMNREELGEAIPPAYTAFIGARLMDQAAMTNPPL